MKSENGEDTPASEFFLDDDEYITAPVSHTNRSFNIGASVFPGT